MADEEMAEGDAEPAGPEPEGDSEIGAASGMPAGSLKTIRKIVLILALITFVFGGILIYSEDALPFFESLIEPLLAGFTTESAVRSIVLSSDTVKAFMKNSSGTDMHFSHFRAQDATLIFKQMRSDCNLSNPDQQGSAQGIQEIYRATVDDKGSNRSLVAWVDWQQGNLICVVRGGNWTAACRVHAYSQCYDNNFYWYNSCGEREDMKLSCFGICRNNTCTPNCVLDGLDARPTSNITCCEGLERVPNATVNNESICIPPINNSFVCTECGNGLCQPPENECSCPADCNVTCNDTDGLDYFNQGNVIRNGTVKWDDCVNTKILTEFYCEYKALLNQTFECLSHYNYTCHHGRCRNTTIPCVGEGQVAPDEEFYECCRGLTESNIVRDDPIGCKTNPVAFTCINCTNDDCGLGETPCNCPGDC
jgi:hypothetical protein